MQDRQLFLGGDFVAGDEVLSVVSPYSGASLGDVGAASPAQLETAIALGQAAEKAMAAQSAHSRCQILRDIASGLQAERETFAAEICAEAGKPITAARGEVDRAVQTFLFAAEEAWRLFDAMDLGAVPTGAGRLALIRRRPVGLCAAISPFNFPLNLVAHKLAPGFAAGCPVILKPASQTPRTALRLAAVCAAAGLPKGALSVLPASRRVADVLTTDPRIRLLSFTGSPAVGWEMKARAGKKRVVLELGGNAAVLVEPGADLAVAAKRVAYGAFAYAGQVCISVQRVGVHASVYDTFRGLLSDAIRDIVICGDPADPAVSVGPLIDSRQADRVMAWIDEARAEGATLLCGGTRDGNVIAPTVLEQVPTTARVSCEEVFGPVATLFSYPSLDDGLAQVNDSRFGLQAGIFTDSVRDLWRAYDTLEVGGVIHNDVPTFRVDQMPYGGVKDSGFGREGVPFALHDYTEERLLVMHPTGP